MKVNFSSVTRFLHESDNLKVSDIGSRKFWESRGNRSNKCSLKIKYKDMWSCDYGPGTWKKIRKQPLFKKIILSQCIHVSQIIISIIIFFLIWTKQGKLKNRGSENSYIAFLLCFILNALKRFSCFMIFIFFSFR